MKRVSKCCVVLALLVCMAGCGRPSPQPEVQGFGFDRITSFDVVRGDGRIHLLLAGKVDGQSELRYVRSTDGGKHWSVPVRVDVGAPPPFGLGHGSDVQIGASADRLLAVWPVKGEGWGGSGPLVSATSSDGGQHWQPGPRPAPGFDGGQGYAALKADRAGHFQLVWLDSRAGQQGLYFARSIDGGQAWSAPEAVDAATCFCCTNELLTSPTGELMVLYRDAEPRDMTLAEYGADGRWQNLGALGGFGWQFNGCPEVGGSLAFAGGKLHALIWTGKPKATGVYYLQSTDGGRSWSAPRRLAETSSHQLSLAARSDDELAAAWGTLAMGGGVAVQFSDDGGAHWSMAGPVLEDNAKPHLVATPSGWLLLMLHDHRALAIAML